MDVMEAIRQRWSVRQYLDKPVEEEKLTRVLEAARMAPSACNLQEWRFVVVRSAETRQKLMVAASRQRFVAEAPVVIAACAETDNYVMRCGQLSYPIDVAIAVDHITLKAVEEGLGSCWVGSFYEEEVRKILGIPPQIRVVQILTLGYPAEEPPREKSRQAFKKIVMWERWGSE